MPIKKISNIPDLNRVAQRLKKTLPRIIANEAKNHFLEGFRRGGGQTNDSRGGWKERKKTDKRPGRAILVKTADLRNDIDVRRTTFNEIVIGTNDTSYASYHNDGTEKLPQREFLGDSTELNFKIGKLIDRKMKEGYK